MTITDLQSAAAAGNVAKDDLAPSAPTPAASASPTPTPAPSPAASTPSIDEYLPALIALQSTQHWLSAAPTFIPQSFQDQIQFVFDGTTYSLYFYAHNQWNKLISSSSSGAFLSNPFTAARAVSLGQALILGNGTSGYLTASQAAPSAITESFNGATENFIGQSFTVSAKTSALRAVLVKLQTNVGGITFTLNVYATSGGAPTGASLGSATFATGGSAISQDVTFTFASAIPVSAGAQYAAIVTTTGPNNSLIFYENVSLTGGAMLSSAAGIVWFQNSAKTLRIKVWEIMTVAGEVQASDTTQTPFSTDANDLALNFIGFALSSVLAGASVLANIGPIDNDQSGLTPGSTYFLNGSAGNISATAGAVSVKIGLALSATQILIKFDNP